MDSYDEVARLIETSTPDEIRGKIYNFKDMREYFERNNVAAPIPSLTRVIDRLSSAVHTPSNAMWKLTPGRNSPDKYKGREFIYDNENKAREDARAILGTVTMVEYVGDGPMKSTPS